MIEYFLEKYKDKTDYDLLSIINNKIDYRHEAVNAAIKIYNERNSTSIPFIGDFNEVKKEENKPTKKKSFEFIKSLRFTEGVLAQLCPFPPGGYPPGGKIFLNF